MEEDEEKEEKEYEKEAEDDDDDEQEVVLTYFACPGPAGHFLPLVLLTLSDQTVSPKRKWQT